MAGKGFYWGANNPYLRTIWVRVRRAPKGLNPSIAMIGNDANPAHIIFECMTNRDWGMGASLGIFDIPSFENSAQTLFDEAFGLSIIWTRSTTIEAFITEVIDHVHGTLFVDPRTGLMTFKLLREDFDYDSLRIITPDNAKLTNFQRKTWGETSNELVVTWTNPANEQEETVAAQDLANISMQGGVISNGRNYYGIRNKDLAARVAERDLRASSMPLATCDVELDRTLWDIVPGEVVKLQWPEKGIAELIVRIGVINYGKPGASVLKTTVYEDVFSLPAAQYLEPPDTEWVDPGEDPAPLENTLILTAPAFITATALALASPLDIVYPEVITLVLGAPDSPDDQAFELIGQITQSNGDLIYDSFGTRDFVGSALLADNIPAEIETVITTFDLPTGGSPLVSSYLVIGSGDDETTEIALVKEVTETGWVLSRGVLDTIPRAWPSGTRVWTLAPDKVFVDTTRRSEGETPEYRFLTQTSRGLLLFEDADAETAALTGRPHLPNRPANTKIGTTGFGTFNATGLTTLPLTWENRNRLLETSQVLAWDGGSVTPEAGQTTTITTLTLGGAVISTIDGLTGTSHSLPISTFGGAGNARVRFTSKRDGFESLQGHEILVTGITITNLGLSGESGELLLSGDSSGDTLSIGAE